MFSHLWTHRRKSYNLRMERRGNQLKYSTHTDYAQTMQRCGVKNLFLFLGPKTYPLPSSPVTSARPQPHPHPRHLFHLPRVVYTDIAIDSILFIDAFSFSRTDTLVCYPFLSFFPLGDGGARRSAYTRTYPRLNLEYTTPHHTTPHHSVYARAASAKLG